MAIYYLDVDDEITSAAQRIRDSSDSRIALVVQTGSRIATSRINFRLLAREAKHRGRRLAIVAADPSVRALAETAGLPAFGSVGEYQKAESARPAVAGADATADALGELAATMDRGSAAAAAGVAGGGRAVVPSPGTHAERQTRVARQSRRLSNAALALMGSGVLIVALLAGYVFIPGATVVLTLREEALGPVTFTALVDPALTSPNDLANAVPARQSTFPVVASGVFGATGENVVETAASGKVTFTSYNTYLAVPVLAGTTVTTAKGIAFTTTAAVTVPKATVSGTTIKAGTADAAVVAVVKGLSGNVPARSIVKVPADLASALIAPNAVTNKSPTAGGTRTVTTFVQQSDVDAAQAKLTEQLEQEFQARLSDPAVASGGDELFAPGAHLGRPSFSPDPSSLVGKTEVEFDMTATATGTALSASTANLTDLAAARIGGMAKTGYALVPGSVALSFGKATPDGEAVKVVVTARALQAPDLDVGKLKSDIKGMTPAEAEAYLSRYGKAKVSVGPFWTSTIPGFDFRIDVQLLTPAPAPTPVPTPRPTLPRTPAPTRTLAPSTSATPSPSPGATPTPTPEPSVSPSDTPPASP